MRISGNALYHTECLILLERIESGIVNLAYIDAPWGTPSTFESSSNEESKLFPEFLSRVLQQVHRLLSDTGTVFFHHSPYSSLYARLVLDQVFGEDGFLAEIILPWRARANLARGPRSSHSTILIYSKTDSFVFNPQYRPLSPELEHTFHHQDKAGKFRLQSLTVPNRDSALRFEWKGYVLPSGTSWRYSREILDGFDEQGRVHFPRKSDELPKLKVYLGDSPGLPVGSVWDDLAQAPSHGGLIRTGIRHIAQQPLALLDRIIKMGSDPGDLILDPFCGSGTTLIAAELNDRRWIGCDHSLEAYTLALSRLKEQLGIQPGDDFECGDEGYIKASFPAFHHVYKQIITGFRYAGTMVFILDQPVHLEEFRGCEFKEITGKRAVDSIKNTADEYAVAFLNDGRGGRVLWGIRDSDRVIVGIQIEQQTKDKLRRSVVDKLCAIIPKIEPGAYKLVLHRVYREGAPVPDLYVVELQVPEPTSPGPYSTGSGEVFVKTDSGKKKLNVSELTDWIVRHRAVEV